MDDPESRRALLDTLRANGVAEDRVLVRGESHRYEHMRTYNDVDIVLDSFPTNGGVSTYEALYMGVPVVSKLGGTMQSRSGCAVLTAMGLTDWVAKDIDGYVRIAVEKSRDIGALGALRRSLRATIQNSEAGNGARYARAVEASYRRMWRTWCAAGAPADAARP